MLTRCGILTSVILAVAGLPDRMMRRHGEHGEQEHLYVTAGGAIEIEEERRPVIPEPRKELWSGMQVKIRSVHTGEYLATCPSCDASSSAEKCARSKAWGSLLQVEKDPKVPSCLVTANACLASTWEIYKLGELGKPVSDGDVVFLRSVPTEQKGHMALSASPGICDQTGFGSCHSMPRLFQFNDTFTDPKGQAPDPELTWALHYSEKKEDRCDKILFGKDHHVSFTKVTQKPKDPGAGLMLSAQSLPSGPLAQLACGAKKRVFACDADGAAINTRHRWTLEENTPTDALQHCADDRDRKVVERARGMETERQDEEYEVEADNAKRGARKKRQQTQHHEELHVDRAPVPEEHRGHLAHLGKACKDAAKRLLR